MVERDADDAPGRGPQGAVGEESTGSLMAARLEPAHGYPALAWWEPMRRLHALAGQLHTFAVGPGMARVFHDGVWSLGEVVFGADRAVWYVHSQAEAPTLGALLKQRFPEKTAAIDAALGAASGRRLGEVLVHDDVFEASELARALKIQAALGLLDIAERAGEHELDIAWTALADGGERLPAPDLHDVCLTAAHRLTMGTDAGAAVEHLVGLRRALFGGVVYVRVASGELYPVRRFGSRNIEVPDLYRLADQLLRDAPDGDGAATVVLDGSDRRLCMVRHRDAVAAAFAPAGDGESDLAQRALRVLG
jgi:hypothetical protein